MRRKTKPYNSAEESSGSIKNYDNDANNGNIRTQSHLQINGSITNPIGSKQIVKCHKEENVHFTDFGKWFCSRSVKYCCDSNNVISLTMW